MAGEGGSEQAGGQIDSAGFTSAAAANKGRVSRSDPVSVGGGRKGVVSHGGKCAGTIHGVQAQLGLRVAPN